MATNSQVVKTITIQLNTKDSKIKIDGITRGFVDAGEAAQNFSAKASQGFDALATGANKARTATGSASATVLEAGRVVSDFNYGIRGVANNLSQLANNFIFTAEKAGGLAEGVKDIGKAFMGPLGIILAINVVIAAFERYSMEAEKAKKATDDLNDSVQDQIRTLNIYKSFLDKSNTSLETRNAIVKDLSILDKDLSKKLKEANGDREKENEIVEKFIKNLELETLIKEKKSELDEAELAYLEIKEKVADPDLRADRVRNLGEQGNLYRERNKILFEYLDLIKQLNVEEETSTKKKIREKKEKAPVFGDPIFDVDALLEGYDETKTLEFDLQRRRLESRQLYYDEARIQASEANNRILEDEIAHREKMLIQTDMSSLERIEAENELAMMRMDLQDQEFEHEMLLLDLRMQAQLEYIDFVSGLGQVFTRLGKESEALAKVGLVIQKGAAIAGVVIEAQKANAEILSASAAEVGFYKASAAATALASPPISAGFLKLAGAAEVGAAKRITKNNVGAGIAIANILATTLTSKTAPSGGGRAGGAEGVGVGGGRTFDFNLAGTTGINQLAGAVGAQFQEPIQAYVVSSQITSQQELDLEIQTGASLGD